MPRPHCPSLPSAAPALDLADLARRYAHDAHPDDAALLVRIRRRHHDVECAHSPLPLGAHPAPFLLGRTVRRWHAVGWVAPVTLHRLDTAPLSASVALLVGRRGEVGHEIVAADGPVASAPPTGLMVDLPRRALGLATPPPVTAPAEFWSEWAATAPPGTPHLADLLPHADLTSPQGWSAVRAWLAAPADDLDPVAALVHATFDLLSGDGLAGWHDDGSFARCLEASLRSPFDVQGLGNLDP